MKMTFAPRPDTKPIEGRRFRVADDEAQKPERGHLAFLGRQIPRRFNHLAMALAQAAMGQTVIYVCADRRGIVAAKEAAHSILGGADESGVSFHVSGNLFTLGHGWLKLVAATSDPEPILVGIRRPLAVLDGAPDIERRMGVLMRRWAPHLGDSRGRY